MPDGSPLWATVRARMGVWWPKIFKLDGSTFWDVVKAFRGVRGPKGGPEGCPKYTCSIVALFGPQSKLVREVWGPAGSPKYI